MDVKLLAEADNQFVETIKKNVKEAENISKQYSISQKEAVKDVNAKNNAAVKANNAAKKQAEEIAKIQKNVLIFNMYLISS